jgi:hypothetical protein
MASYRFAREYLEEARRALHLAASELLALEQFESAIRLTQASQNIAEMRNQYARAAKDEGPEKPNSEELNLGDRGPDDSGQAPQEGRDSSARATLERVPTLIDPLIHRVVEEIDYYSTSDEAQAPQEKESDAANG